MRKLIATMILATLSVGLFAQNVGIPSKANGMLPGVNADHIKMPKMFRNIQTRADVHNYYNFVRTLDNWTSNGNSFSSVLFPDTNTLVRYSDGAGGLVLGYVSWCSVGASFDPRSALYADFYGDDYQLEDSEPYTLDTLLFLYTYERFTSDDVVDTLVIQLWATDKLSYYTWTTNSEPFATVDYNAATGEGTNYTQEFRIPLTINDTFTFATGMWGIWQQIIPGGMELEGPVAATWTFKPGYSYSTDDTMGGEWDNPVPYKPLNTFQFSLYQDNEAWPLESYNNGLLVPNWERYDKWPEPHHRYFAGTGWTSYSYYVNTYFGISFDDAWINSIEDVDANFAVGDVYPNPADISAKLGVELKNTSNLKVEVLNSLGQVMEVITNDTYPAGQHTIDINTSELESGMYICRISAGNSTITKQMLVR